MRTHLLLMSFAVIAFSMSASAQDFQSVHRAESERQSVLFQGMQDMEQAGTGRMSPGVDKLVLEGKALTKHVLGWHPYWMGDTYTSFDYSLLSTIAYFSYEVDTATGSYTTVRQWKTTDLIPYAHERGTKVLLTVTNFGNANNAAVLRSPAKRQTLIDSLWALVGQRNADGVNIDFEGITDASLRDSLTAFMRDLSQLFHSGFRPLDVSMALPAVDWSGIFDVKELGKWVDYCVMMGYDYHWQSGPEAGPVAPLDSSQLWGKYSVLRSVRTYLAAGFPRAKFLLGVPYYGFEWPVTASAIPAQTAGAGSSMQYHTAEQRVATHGRRWDPASSTPYYLHSTEQRQGWYDDHVSLGIKYDSVLSYDLGGIGIWALGYDGTRTELWDLLRDKFSLPSTVSESNNEPEVVVFSVAGRISVVCRLDASAPVVVEVYDMLGRLVASHDRGVQSAGRVVLDVPVEGMSGTYLVRVRVGDMMWDKIAVW